MEEGRKDHVLIGAELWLGDESVEAVVPDSARHSWTLWGRQALHSLSSSLQIIAANTVQIAETE